MKGDILLDKVFGSMKWLQMTMHQKYIIREIPSYTMPMPQE